MASAVPNVESSGFVDNWQTGKSLAECNLHMLTSGDSCDLNFRIGKDEKIVRAHRYILISRSCVFHAMLCGPLSEKDDIKIPDVDEEIFTVMLKYLYTENAKLTPDNVTGLLYLSKKYAIGGLERQCLTYLDTSLSPENACVILEQAHSFDETELLDKALKVINGNGEICITKPGFKDLCHKCLDKVIKLEPVVAKADSLFQAVLTWTKAECERQGKAATPENERHALGDIILHLPFTQMEAKDFASLVVPTGILSAEECTKLFCFFSLSHLDVSPFKVRSKRSLFISSAYHEITLSEEVMSVSQPEQVSSVIIFTPSKDVYLIGFKTHGWHMCFEYTYDIKMEKNIGNFQLHENFLNISGSQCDSDEVEVILPKPYLLNASTRYAIHVKTVKGVSGKYGTYLKSKVKADDINIAVQYPRLCSSLKSVLSKVIIEKHFPLI